MKKALFSVALTGVFLLTGCKMFGGAKNDSCPCGPECKCGQNPCTCKDGTATAKAPGVHPDSSKWMPLFNADLSNAVYDKNVWFVNDKGWLTANKDDAIWSGRDYENFQLDLEYMFDPAANSGVMIYCSNMANWIPSTIEIQILDDNNEHWKNEAPHNKNGGLYGHTVPKVNNVKPAGEWNRMTVTAQGKHVVVAVNGEITVDADISQWTDSKKNPDGSDIPPWLSTAWATIPTKGRIGFQGKHGGAGIYFRNIKVKEL